jgi:hypothetical protein
MRRIFADEQGNKIEQLDLWDYGYDARTRPWYREAPPACRPDPSQSSCVYVHDLASVATIVR